MACHCGAAATGVDVALEEDPVCSDSPLFSPSSPEDAGDFEATGSEASLGVVGLGLSSPSDFSLTFLPFALGSAESLGDIAVIITGVVVAEVVVDVLGYFKLRLRSPLTKP